LTTLFRLSFSVNYSTKEMCTKYIPDTRHICNFTCVSEEPNTHFFVWVWVKRAPLLFIKFATSM